jgi:hypothetical protein
MYPMTGMTKKTTKKLILSNVRLRRRQRGEPIRRNPPGGALTPLATPPLAKVVMTLAPS